VSEVNVLKEAGKSSEASEKSVELETLRKKTNLELSILYSDRAQARIMLGMFKEGHEDAAEAQKLDLDGEISKIPPTKTNKKLQKDPVKLGRELAKKFGFGSVTISDLSRSDC
jgi:hypothetical protein